MLLDLPPELINLIVGHLAPPARSRDSDVGEFERSSTYLAQQSHDRELVLYNAELPTVRKAYETDVLRLGMADPYLAQCLCNGGWHGVVDSLLLGQRKDLGEPGIIPYVPEEFRGMVRKIKFSLALYESYEPPAHYLDRATTVPMAPFPTLSALLRQFPSAHRLAIDMDLMGRDPDVIDGIFGEGPTEIKGSTSTAESMSLELLCQIRDLVLNSTEYIPLLAATLPLPLLNRLHVPVSFDMENDSDVEDPASYPTLFDNFGSAAAGWPSLEKVQVCLQITLDNTPDALDTWNLWQTPLTSLFRAFHENPSCAIELHIAYTIASDWSFPIDHSLDSLPDGTRLLHTPLAPTSETDVRTFLVQHTEHPVPRFDLAIEYRDHYGEEPKELVKVSYRPPIRMPSNSIATPAEGVLDFISDRERLAALYENATQRW